MKDGDKQIKNPLDPADKCPELGSRKHMELMGIYRPNSDEVDGRRLFEYGERALANGY